MSARMEKLLELQIVTDHDCGNYRIGEIDFLPTGDVRRYVLRHEQYGIDQLHRTFFALMEVAYAALREKRINEKVGQCSAGSR